MPSDDSAASGGRGGRLDELFAALAHDRRRRVLRYFLEQNEDAADLDELARWIAARDDGSTEEPAVAIDLHHADLPRLERADVVEYDARSKVARYRGGDRLETLWETLAEASSRDASPTRDR